ncbi:hypothetical protein ABE042_04965 [Viridibacillus arvi]|uniref:hypothetical protein n=1 Tax=Viridibacillus arvi TaxID=263475 RepID=UPI003D293B7A
MENQLAFADVPYNAVINILDQRGLFSAHEEMSSSELENFFDKDFYVFESDEAKADVVQTAVELLDAEHIKQLTLSYPTSTFFEVLIAQGFLSNLGRYYVVSVEYPLGTRLVA